MFFLFFNFFFDAFSFAGRPVFAVNLQQSQKKKNPSLSAFGIHQVRFPFATTF